MIGLRNDQGKETTSPYCKTAADGGQSGVDIRKPFCSSPGLLASLMLWLEDPQGGTIAVEDSQNRVLTCSTGRHRPRCLTYSGQLFKRHEIGFRPDGGVCWQSI